MLWAQQERIVKRLLRLSWGELEKAVAYYRKWEAAGNIYDLLDSNAHATNATELLTGFSWKPEPPYASEIIDQWETATHWRSVIARTLLGQISL